MVAFWPGESRGGADRSATRGPVAAESARSPEVVRERLSHLGDGRVSGTLIFDREFSGREVSRFYAQRSDGDLNPGDFQLAGRVLQYECPEADEPRWRLAAEILPRQELRDVRQDGADEPERACLADGPIV